MGSSASVFGIADDSRSTINALTMTLEQSNRIHQLREDLISELEVRLAFAGYVWDRGVYNDMVRELILKMDEAYMCHIVIQDLWEDERDGYADIILYYLDSFSKSMAYDHYYRMSSRVEVTPPLSRSSSVVGPMVTSDV